MSMIAQVPLKDGTILDVFRFILKGKQTNLPEWVLPFAQRDLPAFWGDYYSDLWNGKHVDCCDYLYVGSIQGTPCSRMWFGFSQKTGSGNFGNVLTLPEYRRRGIMKILLDLFISDFYESGALFCSCDAAESAAPAYTAAGFQRIFSEAQHPMAIVSRRVPNFSAVIKKAYGNTDSAIVRAGTFCDRFDCDKLLWYAPEVYGQVKRHPEFPDYLRLWAWTRQKHVPLYVLETASGFCAGYAVRHHEMPFIFLHPAFEKYREIFLYKILKEGE